MKTEQIKSLEEMYQSESYQMFESDTLLNPQYHMINNTDVDVDKMIEYNAEGMFGLSHSNFIESWRDYLNNVSDYPDDIKDSIEKEIDDCESWHIKNGSIDDLI